jgi:hypothetical protein
MRTLTIVRNCKQLEKPTFRKLDCFRLQVRGERHILWCLLENPNLNHLIIGLREPVKLVSSFPLTETETDPVYLYIVFLVFRFPDDGRNPQTQ